MIPLPTRSGKLHPFPQEYGERPSHDLDLQVKVQAATGWFDLEDGAHYSVHADSLASKSVSYRQRTVENDFVEGSFIATSVRENITETLAFWVSGSSHYEWRTYVDKLTDALEQLSYLVMVRIEDMAEYWTCSPAQWTVETQREFIHARMGVVRASIPRLPTALVVPATGDET